MVPEKLYTLIHVNHMELSKNMLLGIKTLYNTKNTIF